LAARLSAAYSWIDRRYSASATSFDGVGVALPSP
jgi:hypothetical protein